MEKLPDSLMSILVDWMDLMYTRLIIYKTTFQERYPYYGEGYRVLDTRYQSRSFIEYYTCLFQLNNDRHINLILDVCRKKRTTPFPTYISKEWALLDKGHARRIDITLPVRIRRNSIIGDNLIFIDKFIKDLTLKLIEFF